MDSQKRLSLLKNMLARLTGDQPPEPVTAAVPPPSPDPRERKLQLLRSMLSKLQGS